MTSVTFLFAAAVLLCTWQGSCVNSSPECTCADNSTEYSCTNFGYGPDNGPSHWEDFCIPCNYYVRSPIDVGASGVVRRYNRLLLGNFFGNNDKSYSFLLQNDNFTVTVRLTDSEELCIDDTPLGNLYCLDHMQFHWGREDEAGSEHLIYGRRYAMERQWGFYQKSYGSYEEASKHEYGLVRVGQPIQLVENDHPLLAPIVDNLQYVREPGQVAYPEVRLAKKWIRPEIPEQEYYFYIGTLTTPPCTQVLWFIYDAQRGVSRSQIAEFRKLMSPHGPLLENWTPVDGESEVERSEFVSTIRKRSRAGSRHGVSRAKAVLKKHH